MAEMGSFKSRITTIIKKTNEKFGGQEDILDFPGISCELIVESLNESHSQLSELERHKETFEVIYLKRHLDKFLTEIKSFFDDEITPKSFDNFLNNISKIKLRIRETYLLVVENCIRTEAAISKAKDALDSLLEDNDSLQKLQENATKLTNEITALSTNYKARSDEIESTIASAEEVYQNYDDYLISIDSLKKEQLGLKNESEQILNQLKGFSAKSADHQRKTDQITKQLDKSKTENERLQKQINEISTSTNQNLEKLTTDANLLIEKINEILEDANRASMAGSFKEQMEGLEKPLKDTERNKIIALSAMFITLIGIFTNCFGFLTFSSNNELFSWATKIAIISPLVWIAWIETKKYNILSRIKEDYAYKYASAVAFEGYNRKAGEVSEEMQRKLLDIAINNLGYNPVRLFDSSNIHGSPAESVIKETLSSGQKIISDITTTIKNT